jgi:proteasome accessory factor B
MVAAFTGVAERRTLRFRYRGEDREVDPFRLEFLRGRWYLNGFDHLREANRWFRLGRVEGRIAVGDEPGAFEAPTEPIPELRLDPFAFGGGAPPVQAEVWFDHGVRTSVLAGLDDPKIVRDDDDGLVLRLDVTNREGFRSWIASFLDRAEVKAPADLRAEFVAWLQAVASGGPAPEPAGEQG